jgi:Exo-beta-D-glucosaminidase Ig-fold domain/Glycosyl hydrolases family 2/Glycosyl hydrolases family 2, TIM barrel domain/Beta-galactosidase jelly roll domain
MSKQVFTRYLAVILLLHSNTATLAQGVKQEQLKKFSLQSTYIVKAPGSLLSTSAYPEKDFWYPVNVPGTVLSGLVANKVYPDPYQGMNNMMIPDASDSFNIQYNLGRYSHIPGESNPWKKPYWYRTVFQVPAADKGKYFQLIFKGINYRAEVWLNGKLLADSSAMAGMFAEYSLNASKAIKPGDKNILAVKIFPLDYPGYPSKPQLDALGDFYENGGPTGDIGKNVTMLCSVGWDWIPEVHDRNMGIWQPVYLRTSGQVVIEHPFIVTTLPALPDTSEAKIKISLGLNNHSNSIQKGKLSITITPENFTGKPFTISRALTISAQASEKIELNEKSDPSLNVKNPMLWWPNGYGKPNVYRIRIQFISENSVSDDTSFIFGIRTVGSKAEMVNGWARRDFYVNGRKIHLAGGAFVPDMLLNIDSTRYDDELKLCRNANVNLVRIWGGGIAPPDVFFELADRYGQMVWNDFWVTGDTQGEFKGSPDWPLEGNIFIRNMRSTIFRIRNHPSLLVWTGGNEGHARKELYDAMRESIATIDGTRPFIPSSSGFAKLPAGWNGSWPDDQPTGVYSGGPYTWQDAAQYYKLVNNGRDWLFKDETGLPSQPPYSTLKLIIPDLVPDPKLPYPLNNMWGYHDACSGNGKFDIYYKAMAERYGQPTALKEFSDKMQLLNADAYRGIFEAVGHKLNETGGVMLWKLNAAFPSVVWQIYDWYLQPNAGYYFMQKACEPIHIQLNLDDSMVAIINRTNQPQNELQVEAEVFSSDGKKIYRQVQQVNTGAPGAFKTFSLAQVLKKAEGVQFILLRLKDAGGKLISHNTYWLEAKHNYRSLQDMPVANITTALTSVKNNGEEYHWKITFRNPSDKIAFFIHPALMLGETEIRPSFWRDNYFTLAPGESLATEVSAPERLINGNHLRIISSGLNVAEMEMPLSQK